MSIWDKIQEFVNVKENNIHAKKRDTSRYAFIDTEIGVDDHRIHDIGAIRYDGAIYRGASKTELFSFLKNIDYICGHNIIQHDAKYLIKDENIHWQCDNRYGCSRKRYNQGWRSISDFRCNKPIRPYIGRFNGNKQIYKQQLGSSSTCNSADWLERCSIH